MTKKIITLFALSLIFAPSLVLAADPLSFTPQISIPESNFIAEQATPIGDNAALICDYIIAVYKYGIMIIGVFAVVAMAVGGAMWILAMGNSKLVATGKDWIISGLLGLALALGAFMILATINKDLVTCNIQTIKKIEYKKVPDEKLILPYGKEATLAKKPCVQLDNSGVMNCCVAYGDMDGSGILDDDDKKYCCTVESQDKVAAQQQCYSFYNKIGEKGTSKSALRVYLIIPYAWELIFGDNLLKLEPHANRNNGEFNSATIYEGACWQNSQTKNWCKGKDEPEYCGTRADGRLCLTSTGTWGYCENKTCNTCKKHCQACTNDNDYQCPNQTKSSIASEAGFICSNSIYSGAKEDSNDCTNFYGNYFCDREFDVNGDGEEDNCYVCGGVANGTLCVTANDQQGTCQNNTCQPMTQ